MMNDIKKNENGLSLWDSFSSLWNDAFSKEMKTDIEETSDKYVLAIEVPGISKDNITVTFEDNTLTVHVKSETKKEDKEEKSYIRKERTTMDMERSYYLDDVDENSITAKIENGILTLSVSKLKEKVNPKKVIQID